MKPPKMCCNLAFKLLILIILTLSNSSEARNTKHLHPSAVIVGTVFCDTCFQDDFSRSSHFISGATVSVECKDADAGSFKKEVETDEEGKFRVHLPVSISKHEKEIKGCQVRLVKSSDPYCAVASTASSSSIHLKSRKQGTRVFSAGFFTFKPLKQPDVCNQQPEEVESITRPQFFFFPPVFPSPPPAIGGVPLPPNPLQPPPLVPVPFPPNPLQPPSPPAFGFPHIPGFPSLIPPPPPPPPVIPGLPIPPGLPRFPPIFPGAPPAKKTSP